MIVTVAKTGDNKQPTTMSSLNYLNNNNNFTKEEEQQNTTFENSVSATFNPRSNSGLEPVAKGQDLNDSIVFNNKSDVEEEKEHTVKIVITPSKKPIEAKTKNY